MSLVEARLFCLFLLFIHLPTSSAETTSLPSPAASPIEIGVRPPISRRLEDRFHDALKAHQINRFDGNLREELANLTPEEIPIALQIAASMPDLRRSQEFHQIYSGIFRRWATFVEPQTLLPETDKIDDPLASVAIKYVLVAAWGEKDPIAAIRYDLTLPISEKRDNPIHNIIALYTKNDVNRAAEIVEQCGPAKIPVSSIIRVVSSLSPKDPARALKIWLAAQADRPQNDRRRMNDELAPIFQRFGEIDPQQGIVAIDSLTEKAMQETARAGLVSGWAEKEPAAALAWLRSKHLLTAQVGEAFFRQWAKTDSAAAASAVIQLDDSLRTSFSFLIARIWSENDPAAATAWVKTLPDSEEKQNFFLVALSRLNASDPALATRKALELPPGDQRIQFLVTAIRAWAKVNPAAARDWISTIPNPADSEPAAAALLEVWAQSDSTAASIWVSSLPATPARNRAIKSLIEIWPKEDLAHAGAWLQSFPQEVIAENVRIVTERWVRVSPDEVLHWTASLTSGAIHDAAIAGIASNIAQERAAEIMPLALAISEENLRNEAMANAAAKWFASDLVAATKWIVSSPLSELEKRKLFAKATDVHSVESGDFNKSFDR